MLAMCRTMVKEVAVGQIWFLGRTNLSVVRSVVGEELHSTAQPTYS